MVRVFPRQVPSFALVVAGLSTFPARNLSADVAALDPCAARLPALANSTLAALVRCSNVAVTHDGGSVGGVGEGPAGLGAGGGIGRVLKPLADSLSPLDAYHWRQSLVAAASAKVGPSNSSKRVRFSDDRPKAVLRQKMEHKAKEDGRAAALDLLHAAVTEQPALMVVMFWSQPPRSVKSPPGGFLWQDVFGLGGSGIASPGGGGGGTKEQNEASRAAVSGGASLSSAVLSILEALLERIRGEFRRISGTEEALSKALDLVLALWHAEGVGRLGQV